MNKILTVIFILVIPRLLFCQALKGLHDTKLIFTSKNDKGLTCIYYLDEKENRPKTIVSDLQSINDIRWSPNGYIISFIGWYDSNSNRPVNDKLPQIYVYYLENNYLYQVTNYQTEYDDYFRMVKPLKYSWCKDNEKLLYFYNTIAKNEEIVISDLRSLNNTIMPMPTTYGGILDISAWSHNGEYIALCDVSNLYLYSFLTNKWQRLTNEAGCGMEGNLQWSLDDKNIYYNCDNRTMVYNLDKRQKTTFCDIVSNITWTINGDNMIFLLKNNARIQGHTTPVDSLFMISPDINNKRIFLKEGINKFVLLSDSIIAYIKNDNKGNTLYSFNIYTKENKLLVSNKYNPSDFIGFYK